MDLTTLVATGTIGWVFLIGLETVRGCLAGHVPSAILSGSILAILTVNLWALVPSLFGLDQNLFRYVMGWMIAGVPFVFVTGRIFIWSQFL